MNRKRLMYVSTACTLMVGLLAACTTGNGTTGGPPGSNGDGPPPAANSPDGDGREADLKEGQTELRVAWWGSQTRHDRTIEAIELFEEKYPDIAVSYEFTGWGGYWERLATQAAGQNLPDVIQMDLQYLNEYVSRGLLADLDPYIESGILNLDDVDELYLEGGRIDDSLYAVNLGSNAVALAYDPAMFAEAGIPELEPGYTWDDYIDTARQFKEYLGKDGYFRAISGSHGFKHYLRQHDLWLYNEDNTGLGYDDDQYFIDFFSIWGELLAEDVIPGPEFVAEVQGLQDELIVHGISPVHQFYSNEIVALQSAADRPLKLTLWPSMPGGTDGHFVKPGQFFSVTTQSNKEEAAAKFIDFMTNDLGANEALAAERGVPISGKVREHLYPQLGEYEQLQFDYMDIVEEYASPIHPPEPAGTSEVMNTLGRLYQEYTYGLITVEEFAENFRNAAEEILGDG